MNDAYLARGQWPASKPIRDSRRYDGPAELAERGVRLGPRKRGRRGEPEAAGPRAGQFSGHGRAQAADHRNSVLRFWIDLWTDHLQPLEEPAGAPLDARGLRADLRDLQNLSVHAGQVLALSLGVHCGRDRAVFRRAVARS